LICDESKCGVDSFGSLFSHSEREIGATLYKDLKSYFEAPALASIETYDKVNLSYTNTARTWRHSLLEYAAARVVRFKGDDGFPLRYPRESQ